MSGIQATGLPAALRAFPGMVLEVALDGVVLDSNGRMERLLGRAVVGTPIGTALDEASRLKLGRALGGPADGAYRRMELTLEGERMAETRVFHLAVSAGEGGGPPRALLVETPPEPRMEQVYRELTEVNAELVNTQRELAKKSARLTRALEELEHRLEENQRLSRMLQDQNDEMEVQNEELLAITEQLHQGQEELLVLNQQLERRTRELQLALSGRSRFYSSMSHELRTPVNAVLGYNDLLLAGLYGPLNEQQEVALERAQRAVRHLRDLVNDVLDLAKIEADKMDVVWEEVSLHEMLEELVSTVMPIARSHGAEIRLDTTDCPAIVVTDARRVRQILLNLLSNAIKYGGGRPVFVRCTRPPAGGIAIEVVDNGEGIAPESLASIFEEFVQLRGPEGGQGTGLGLPIAKRLAELIGGTLEASSTVGVGSTFRLTIPSKPPRASRA